jgi:uncharacterized protein YndB with AHSA1/START domain
VPDVSGWRRDGEVEAYVDAPPEEVYRLVADVTTVGERSSECWAAEWLPGAEPGAVGARFRGRNRSGRIARWSRVCEVLEADPGRSFVYRTVPERLDLTRADSTTWSWTFTPEGSGTRVRHAYRITRLPLQPFRALAGALMPHHRDMRPHMAATLAAVRQALETV